MGFLNGDSIAWQRWWLPARDEELALWNGMLPDPRAPSFRFFNRGLVCLADCLDARAIILLADGGMGKSVELRREVDQLVASGRMVVLVDLGACASVSEVTEAVTSAQRVWREAGAPDDLVVALDGLDEALVDISNLRDVLAGALSRLDTDRLRIMVACRTSLWPSELSNEFIRWWGEQSVVTLFLAPLTSEDVEAAARSEGLDSAEFLRAVLATDAGPMAARPITLRLLLSGTCRDGEPSSSRLDVYRTGVQGLAMEQGARRNERRRTGVARDRRLSAARQLAAVSLLAGRPIIARRTGPEQTASAVALDEIAESVDELAALDDVWDSALLAGEGATRSWCHHSVAEFLCAEALSALPADSAWALLAAPGDPARLKPQLEETAAWTAGINDAMFELLVDVQPWLLVDTELNGSAEYRRHRVGRAVVDGLVAGELVPERVRRGSAPALTYPGIEEALKPLLDAGRPMWQRRETVMLIAMIGLRSMNPELIGIVEDSRAQPDRDDEVQLAVYAAHALSEVADAMVDRVRGLVDDPEIPDRVRAALVDGLFPERIGVEELMRLVTPRGRFSAQFGQTVMRAMSEAVSRRKVGAEELAEWFVDPPESAQHDASTRELAASVALAAVAEGPTSPHWRAATRIVRWLLHSGCHLVEWSSDDINALAPDHRRELSRAVLDDNADGVLVASIMADQGLLRSDDLLWWLDRFAERPHEEGYDGSAESISISVLSWLILDDDNTLALAQQRCAKAPTLSAIVQAEFSEQTVAHRRHIRAQAAERNRWRARRQAESLFSAQRLSGHLAAGDFVAALEELHRHPDQQQRSTRSGPLRAWTATDDTSRQNIVDLVVRR